MILPTHWSAGMGGAEYQVKCLIERLAPLDRFEIYYVAKRYDSSFAPMTHKVVPIGGLQGRLCRLFFADTLWLWKSLTAVRPDVLFQHNGCAYTGIAARYAQIRNIHMVWHVASDSDLVPSLKDRHPFTIIDTKFLEYGIRNSPCITTQTFQQAHYLKKSYGRIPAAVVPNFQPLPQEKIEKQEPVEIVWVANFKALKQPELFIRLAKDLRERCKGVRCTMIGAPTPSASAWQWSLETEIARIPHLTYHGALPLDMVNAILARAHIFINTSTYEGFPNTFIQAWLRKVPVVSLNVNPDGVFDDRQVGFYAGTYEKLLEQVLELIRNPALREQMGENAAAYARKMHSEDNALRLIEILANGHSS